MAVKDKDLEARRVVADRAKFRELRGVGAQVRQALATSLCPKEQAEYDLRLAEASKANEA